MFLGKVFHAYNRKKKCKRTLEGKKKSILIDIILFVLDPLICLKMQGLQNVVVQIILLGSLFNKDSFPAVIVGDVILVPKEIVISQESRHY